MPSTANSFQTAPNQIVLSKALAPVAALLAISTFINYVDRGSLSLAVPVLKDELHLSPWQLGILLSSFFWTYTSFQIISGWLVDRFNVNWVLAGGFFIWTIATATTGLVHGFQMLLAMRLILGAGESVAFPSYCKILAKHFPEALRGRANSFISAGIAGGPAFGIFFGAMLIGRYGWRPFFIGLGLFSLLWLPPWKWWMPNGPGLDVSPTAQTPGILEILKQRSAWGTFVGLFAFNYLSYFLLTWLPSFLVNERNFSMQKMGTVGGIAYLILALSALMCGWFSDLWIAGGGTPTLVRKTFTTTGLAISSCSCLAGRAFSFRDVRRGRALYGKFVVDHADDCGPAGSRKMERAAKLFWEFRRDYCPCAYRSCRATHGTFLLGVCCYGRSVAGRGYFVGLCCWGG
jgi:ACS family D-galactonate transporter-like MFS transporter